MEREGEQPAGTPPPQWMIAPKMREVTVTHAPREWRSFS
jgi:hypothetical protein